MSRIFSGVQPTGDLHLGNYLGAIRNFVRLQEDFECLYCVVDLHAITVWQDPAQLAANTREVAAAFLAAGIDPAHSIMFNQSRVPAHAELAWIFNCVARRRHSGLHGNPRAGRRRPETASGADARYRAQVQQ
jgi:tryptophanyl-tRNA synthetase